MPSFPLDNNWKWCVNDDSCSPTLRLLIQTIYSNEFRPLKKPEVSRGLRRNCRLLSNTDDEDITSFTPATPFFFNWALHVFLVCLFVCFAFKFPVNEHFQKAQNSSKLISNIYFQSKLSFKQFWVIFTFVQGIFLL